MKYLTQLSVIIAVCFAGELVKFMLPFPVPGSIYGMVIMFLLLSSGFLKLEKVEKVSDYLIDCLSLMFVPGGVALMKSADTLKQMLPAAICSVLLVTPFVMIVTGRITQAIMRKGGNK